MSGSLLDSNVWVAATFPAHPFHRPARAAIQQATSAEPAVFCRSTQQSFLRLITTPALLKAYGTEGLTNHDALSALEILLALPQVAEREEPPGLGVLWHRLADRDTASPKLWMDAYLAAFAMGSAIRLVTLDRDFERFQPHGLDLFLISS